MEVEGRRQMPCFERNVGSKCRLINEYASYNWKGDTGRKKVLIDERGEFRMLQSLQELAVVI